MADSAILTFVLKDAFKRVRPASIPPTANFSDTWFESRGAFINSNGRMPSGHTIAGEHGYEVGSQTPCGRDWDGRCEPERHWTRSLPERHKAGTERVRRITRFDASRHQVQIAGEVTYFDESALVAPREDPAGGRRPEPLCAAPSPRGGRNPAGRAAFYADHGGNRRHCLRGAEAWRVHQWPPAPKPSETAVAAWIAANRPRPVNATESKPAYYVGVLN